MLIKTDLIAHPIYRGEQSSGISSSLCSSSSQGSFSSGDSYGSPQAQALYGGTQDNPQSSSLLDNYGSSSAPVVSTSVLGNYGGPQVSPKKRFTFARLYGSITDDLPLGSGLPSHQKLNKNRPRLPAGWTGNIIKVNWRAKYDWLKMKNVQECQSQCTTTQEQQCQTVTEPLCTPVNDQVHDL